jgi:hypothetical protein
VPAADRLVERRERRPARLEPTGALDRAAKLLYVREARKK